MDAGSDRPSGVARERESMRTLIVLASLCASLGLAAFPVKADPIPLDPKAVFHPPSQVGGGGPPTSEIASLPFSFTSPTGTSPGTSSCVIAGVNDDPCDFVNVTGTNWTALYLVILPGDPSTSCSFLDIGFTNCVIDQQGSSSLPSIIDFFGGPGIPNTDAFGVSLVGWSPGTTFEFSTNAPPVITPEPQTIMLALPGVLILIIGERWRKISSL